MLCVCGFGCIGFSFLRLDSGLIGVLVLCVSFRFSCFGLS